MGVFVDELCNQVTTDNKKHIYPDKSTRDEVVFQMKQQHAHYRYSANSINFGPVLEVVHQLLVFLFQDPVRHS